MAFEELDMLDNGDVSHNGKIVSAKFIGRPIVVKVEDKLYLTLDRFIESRKPLQANGYSLSNSLLYDRNFFYAVQYFQFETQAKED